MFQGCMVATVTPFCDDGVDYAKFEELIDFHAEEGTDAIVPCGTTGESPTLSADEHEEVVRRVVKLAAGRMQVIAGTGSNCTAEAIRYTREAEKAGADGALVITPYYNKPTQEGLYQHFKAIAAATALPLVLYNVPGRTGISIEPRTVARLAEIKNITGIKEASGSLDQASEIRSLCDITLISGDDSLTLPIMSVGGVGVISVVGNIVPGDVKKMVAAFNEGDTAEATRLHGRLFPLCRAMFFETNPIPVKTAMKILGRLNGQLRLPMVPMSEANEARLRDAMRGYGLIE